MSLKIASTTQEILLPVEIIGHILSTADSKTLQACSLLSRQWSPVAQKRLLCKVLVLCETRPSPLQHFLNCLETSSTLPAFIKTITFSRESLYIKHASPRPLEPSVFQAIVKRLPHLENIVVRSHCMSYRQETDALGLSINRLRLVELHAPEFGPQDYRSFLTMFAGIRSLQLHCDLQLSLSSPSTDVQDFDKMTKAASHTTDLAVLELHTYTGNLPLLHLCGLSLKNLQTLIIDNQKSVAAAKSLQRIGAVLKHVGPQLKILQLYFPFLFLSFLQDDNDVPIDKLAVITTPFFRGLGDCAQLHDLRLYGEVVAFTETNEGILEALACAFYRGLLQHVCPTSLHHVTVAFGHVHVPDFIGFAAELCSIARSRFRNLQSMHMLAFRQKEQETFAQRFPAEVKDSLSFEEVPKCLGCSGH